MNMNIEQASHACCKADRPDEPIYYPQYHMAPPKGWMNDPNGLIYHKGIYHVFYQHYPYSPQWGAMHWGHATSTDMVHWEHQPVALTPGDSYDREGCFSGCAVDDRGILSLIYTGHVWLGGTGNDEVIRQVQCLATSTDGIHFKKHGMVLAPPPGIMHFRDPKVWFQDGLWWMVVGVRDEKDNGQIYLYRGTSLRDWTFDRVLAASEGDMGYMWECPDFFHLGKESVLMFSPQGIQARHGYERKNRFQSGYLRGQWRSGEAFKTTGPFVEMDHGHDFYAPQSFTAADGRRIVMGWMNMWDSPMPSQSEGWAGSLTLPREISMNADGEIRMRPIVELETLRKKVKCIPPVILDNRTKLLAEDVTAQEIQLAWNRTDSTAERYGIRLGNGCSLWLDNQSRRLVLERLYPAVGLSSYRSAPLNDSKTLSLQVFIDRSSIEVFVNGGEACLSSRIYPSPTDRGLTLFADGGKAVMTSGRCWELKSD